ncbi:hypothetical protein P1X14_15885 [Sphingomonas sp. AOB5]|uniref:hypothetical protein n=1 Tax=Sphingomonas sp. AOB5 TaxID=3034017 RepID=UPI0023F894FC|nr:hypothetical protein [Sphingomonas sp. AOB5]MDF7776738.1 hypothetical protein [Sphingomonas sp. AOB5]
MIRKLLILLALLMPAVARAEWYEASTKHFVIYSDDNPEKIRAYALALERYDMAMRVFRNVENREVMPVERVTVFVVRDIFALQALGRPGAAGFYIPRAGGSVAFTIREAPRDNPGSRVRTDDRLDLAPDVVLRHEYAHHFMFDSYGAAALPMWLTEGFAEFHATAEDMPDGGVRFGRVPLYRAMNFANSQTCTARRILRTSDLRQLSGCRIGDVYAYGWLATHYFTFTPDGPKKIGAYIQAINNGEPLEKAADLLGNPDALEADMRRYLDAPTRTVYTVPAAKLNAAAPVLRKLGPGEAATMSIRIRSQAGVTEGNAPDVYQAAVRAAAPYPNDAMAQRVLAEAAFDAKKYAEAAAAGERAVAADPKMVEALLYVGMAKMELAGAAKATDPQVWREVRSWFTRANKIDGYDPRPLILFYRSFVVAGEAPTKNAEAGMLLAAELAPQDRTLLLGVAYVHLSNRNGAEARKALQISAFDPHNRGSNALANSLIAMIDKGDLAGAAAKLRPYIKDPSYRDPTEKRGG